MLKKISFLISLALLVLMVPGQSSKGSKTGASSIPVIATFGDDVLTPDRIRSDDLGPYLNGQSNVKALIDSRGDFDLDTNTTAGPALRTLYLDFGACASGPSTCSPPFSTDEVDSYLSTAVGGLPNMAVGSSVMSGLQITFTTNSTPDTQWFVNFSSGPYPETSKVTVTRTNSTTWTIQALSPSAIARLSSAPMRGKLILTDHGDYLMPFSVTVQTK